ncbi:MAG: MBOAT family protein [Chloroflexi bacterium]|nr:MBOAT family protein [Chloroflexota bacterium]
MDFTDLNFLFIFLPVFLLLSLLIRPEMKIYVIAAASLVFVFEGQTTAFIWIFALGLIGYILGLRIEDRHNKNKNAIFYLRAGIALNLLLLLSFKLVSAYRETFAAGSFIRDLAAPIGLSYVTFQIISYLTDVFRKNIPAERDALRFALYLLFFPKFVSGPLIRYQPFKTELDKNAVIPFEDLAAGLRRILFGVSKRVLIANQLAVTANAVFDLPSANVQPVFAWLALLAYALQIYFDFSGYTDIALGTAKIIGLSLPENFNYPYIAQSISDFWRRWHISLSNWFREYVFYPLERRRLKGFGQPINLLIVFLLTGLWHGVTINFLIWGGLHGIAIAAESAGGGKRLKSVWQPLRHLYTLAIVGVAWVFFRSPTLEFALEFIGRLAGNQHGLTPMPFSQTQPFPFIEPSFILVTAMGILLSLPLQPAWNNLRKKMETQTPYMYFALQGAEDLSAILLFSLSIAAQLSGGFTPNIYAQF